MYTATYVSRSSPHPTHTTRLSSQALGRYTDLVEKASARSPSPLPRRTSATATVAKATLAVNVGSADETLGQETDESYVLTVDVHGAGVVTAASVFGALHGLESWSQLIEAAGSVRRRYLIPHPVELCWLC